MNKTGSSAVYVINGTLSVTGGSIESDKDDTDAISINGTTVANVSGGSIKGHDWGITALGTSTLNVSGTAVITTDVSEGYAISTNGAILLENNEIQPEWRSFVQKDIDNYMDEILALMPEFTDTDKLKKALEICEINNSHGIKALRLAYKYGDNDNKKQSTIFMADSQVDINGKLKSVTEMTDKEIEEKINQKWGWTF